MAFRPKPQVSPSTEITIPPIIGPTNRAPFMIVDCNAIALGRSSLPSTISIRNDCRLGPSKALDRPSTRLPTIRCQASMWPDATSTNMVVD